MKSKKFIIFILIINLIFISTNIFAASESNNFFNNVNIEYSDSADAPNILSDAAILVDNNTDKILYAKNHNERMYPASTTKILTAILVIENGNLSDTTVASYDAVSVIPAGYSSAYLSEGEEMSIRYLLEVLLIHSANDAANVLAEYISGSIEEFVNLMNEKATSLGCTDSHFVNTNGIHDENHYTTAKDLAIIAHYCMQNSTFRELVSMKSCTIPATNKSEERFYKNTNDLMNETSSYYLENCIGVKTGFTTQAGNCLISCCSQDGLELICVILHANQTETGGSSRYPDSVSLFEYGYSNYALSTIANKGSVICSLNINNGSSSTKNLDAILANDISALSHINASTPEYKVKLNDNLSAPISQNSVIGSITYSIDGIDYTEDLLASHNVEKSYLSLYILVGILIFILVLVIFIRLKIKKRSKIIGRHF